MGYIFLNLPPGNATVRRRYSDLFTISPFIRNKILTIIIIYIIIRNNGSTVGPRWSDNHSNPIHFSVESDGKTYFTM